MRIYYFQHVPFEKPAMIGDWAAARHAEIDGTLFYQEGFALPDPEDVDMLIVMGGPMNIYEEARYPWLKTEKRFIQKILGRGTPVLGICLGAQLLANCLGAKVRPGKFQEVGWFPVEFAAKKPGPFRVFPDRLDVLHWHGDTFDLPVGATLCASSRACRNQAFLFGRQAIGLQFHVEMAEENIHQVAAHSESVSGPFVQRADALFGRQNQIDRNRQLLFRFLDAWAGEWNKR